LLTIGPFADVSVKRVLAVRVFALTEK